MRLSTFKQALAQIDKLQFQLPNGQFVPAHFHLTEAGYVTRDYIDCGGTQRQEAKINFQLFVASDIDHRLQPQKVLDILDVIAQRINIPDVEVEIEYQQSTIGRYRLALDGSVFQLINTQTACLASDQCGIPQEKPQAHIMASGVSCDPKSGCC